MFGKLLKYDLTAVFKYWWIAALSSVVLSFIAGICINIISVDYTQYEVILTLAILALVICIIGVCLFPILTTVLILMRLYKHFFTDEGYLTFTLPVKKSQLLNSKLLMAFIMDFVSFIIIIFDIVFALTVGIPEIIWNPETWNDLLSIINEFLKLCGVGFVITYAAEILLLFIGFSIFTTLLLFFCVIFAASVTKKHKILTAIGVYYITNAIISGITQFILLNSNFFALFEEFSALSPLSLKFFVSILFLVVIGIVAALCAGIYLFNNLLLDKKLNLE